MCGKREDEGGDLLNTVDMGRIGSQTRKDDCVWQFRSFGRGLDAGLILLALVVLLVVVYGELPTSISWSVVQGSGTVFRHSCKRSADSCDQKSFVMARLCLSIDYRVY